MLADVEKPTGQQHVLRAGDATAVVTEVGATLRVLDVGDLHVVEGFDEDEPCSFARGQLLLPWPNRVRDGRWSFDGEEHQLPLDEPQRGNAIHGLVRWANWELLELQRDSVRMRLRLHPQTGWPFPLRCEVRYVLAPDALEVTTTVRNGGSRRAPVAMGAHPYLSAGGGTLEDCRLELPASTVVDVDDRLLPTGRAAVADRDLDFRAGDALRGRRIDLCFGDLAAVDGAVTTRFTRSDGRVVELWQDERFRWVQLFTGDALPPEQQRRALVVEPMTAPPDALATGEDLHVLEPGEELTLRWGIRLV